MLVLGFAAICLAPSTSGQQTAPTPGQGQIQAQIKVARVVGQVTVARADATTAMLHNYDPLSQGDVVITAKGASVVLVFSNGSTVSIGPDSKVAVDEFTQDPFDKNVKLTDLKEEPTTSHTKLNLTYGELVGNVKKLKGESTFQVQTPVGAAGIRGTTFRLVYRPTGTGQAFFSLSTETGVVIFQGTTGASIPVGENREIDIQVKINEKTGQVESVQVTTRGISDEAKQEIEDAVMQAIQALGDTSFDAFFEGRRSQGQQQQRQQQTTPGDGQP
jgi:hypothetical protein